MAVKVECTVGWTVEVGKSRVARIMVDEPSVPKFDTSAEMVLLVVSWEPVALVPKNGILTAISLTGVSVDDVPHWEAREMVKENGICTHTVLGVIGGPDAPCIVVPTGKVIVCPHNEKGFDVPKGILAHEEVP